MKNTPKVPYRIITIILSLIMVAVLVSQSSCSSTSKIGKGKPGMVPCPCEKRNHRR